MEGALSLRGGALESEGTEPDDQQDTQRHCDVSCRLGREGGMQRPRTSNSGGVLWTYLRTRELRLFRLPVLAFPG